MNCPKCNHPLDKHGYTYGCSEIIAGYSCGCRSDPAEIKLNIRLAALEARNATLVEALNEALPHLHWANTHGDRCDEAIHSARANLEANHEKLC